MGGGGGGVKGCIFSPSYRKKVKMLVVGFSRLWTSVWFLKRNKKYENQFFTFPFLGDGALLGSLSLLN